MHAVVLIAQHNSVHGMLNPGDFARRALTMAGRLTQRNIPARREE